MKMILECFAVAACFVAIPYILMFWAVAAGVQ